MKFLDLFPTPKFLTLSEAGVSISERAIHYISFSQRPGRERRLELSGVIGLAEGVVVNGVVNDKIALGNALGRLQKEHGFRYVSVTLPDEKAYLYTTSVEKVAYRDLYDAVAFTVEGNVPLSLPKSIFSFEVLPHAPKVKAAVTVLPLEVVSAYTEALELGGLMPVSYDIESESIARSVIERGDARPSLIVHIGERSAGLYMVDEGVVQFSSTLSLDAKSSDGAALLKTEIRKFFIFRDTKIEESGEKAQKIERVVLCVEGAGNDALVSAIMGDVETPYVLGNVWTNVFSLEKRLPEMPFEASLSYAAAIGAALGQGPHTYV